MSTFIFRRIKIRAGFALILILALAAAAWGRGLPEVSTEDSRQHKVYEAVSGIRLRAIVYDPGGPSVPEIIPAPYLMAESEPEILMNDTAINGNVPAKKDYTLEEFADCLKKTGPIQISGGRIPTVAR